MRHHEQARPYGPVLPQVLRCVAVPLFPCVTPQGELRRCDWLLPVVPVRDERARVLEQAPVAALRAVLRRRRHRQEVDRPQAGRLRAGRHPGLPVELPVQAQAEAAVPLHDERARLPGRLHAQALPQHGPVPLPVEQRHDEREPPLALEPGQRDEPGQLLAAAQNIGGHREQADPLPVGDRLRRRVERGQHGHRLRHRQHDRERCY